MPVRMPAAKNLQRDTLRKIASNERLTAEQRELAQLRIAYSEDSKLLTSVVSKLVGVEKITLQHLPTQASGRWSTWITNWPRACINPQCKRGEHEWTDQCWSIRDTIKAAPDEILVSWDHDNIEGRIHDIILNDTQAIEAHREGYDLHTITCCNIFHMDYPHDLKNPHTSKEDSEWRHRYEWQGKDTKRRVLAKNFNHGSKYTESYKFVQNMMNIEQYDVTYAELEEHAKQYIKSKGDVWQRKLDIMQRIRRERIARSLYGFRRVFFNSSAETGREGFSHMISSTVSDYNNMTLQMLERAVGKENFRVLHNAHDGDKVGINRDYVESWFGSTAEFTESLKDIIERPIEYEGRSLVMTAGIKVKA